MGIARRSVSRRGLFVAGSTNRASPVGFKSRVDIVPFGSLERLCRLLPRGRFSRQLRRSAHKADTHLPGWLRLKAARSQLIVYRQPRNGATETASSFSLSIPSERFECAGISVSLQESHSPGGTMNGRGPHAR